MSSTYHGQCAEASPSVPSTTLQNNLGSDPLKSGLAKSLTVKCTVFFSAVCWSGSFCQTCAFQKIKFCSVCCGTMVEAQCHSVEEFQPLLGLKMKTVILAESGMRSILVVQLGCHSSMVVSPVNLTTLAYGFPPVKLLHSYNSIIYM